MASRLQLILGAQIIFFSKVQMKPCHMKQKSAFQFSSWHIQVQTKADYRFDPCILRLMTKMFALVFKDLWMSGKVKYRWQ